MALAALRKKRKKERKEKDKRGFELANFSSPKSDKALGKMTSLRVQSFLMAHALGTCQNG